MASARTESATGDEEEQSLGWTSLCALEGYISAGLKKLENVPAWHVLPNGLAAYSVTLLKTNEPHRTIAAVAPGGIKDYLEVESEVPIAPYPTTQRATNADVFG